MAKTYNLSYNLKQLRQKKGWIQEDVAKQLDISVPAYSKLELGRTDINFSRLEQIAKLYKTSVVQLLTGNNLEDLQELEYLKDLVFNKDQEIIQLQKKVIDLYRRLHL